MAADSDVPSPPRRIRETLPSELTDTSRYERMPKTASVSYREDSVVSRLEARQRLEARLSYDARVRDVNASPGRKLAAETAALEVAAEKVLEEAYAAAEVVEEEKRASRSASVDAGANKTMKGSKKFAPRSASKGRKPGARTASADARAHSVALQRRQPSSGVRPSASVADADSYADDDFEDVDGAQSQTSHQKRTKRPPHKKPPTIDPVLAALESVAAESNEKPETPMPGTSTRSTNDIRKWMKTKRAKVRSEDEAKREKDQADRRARLEVLRKLDEEAKKRAQKAAAIARNKQQAQPPPPQLPQSPSPEPSLPAEPEPVSHEPFPSPSRKDVEHQHMQREDSLEATDEEEDYEEVPENTVAELESANAESPKKQDEDEYVEAVNHRRATPPRPPSDDEEDGRMVPGLARLPEKRLQSPAERVVATAEARRRELQREAWMASHTAEVATMAAVAASTSPPHGVSEQGTVESGPMDVYLTETDLLLGRNEMRVGQAPVNRSRARKTSSRKTPAKKKSSPPKKNTSPATKSRTTKQSSPPPKSKRRTRSQSATREPTPPKKEQLLQEQEPEPMLRPTSTKKKSSSAKVPSAEPSFPPRPSKAPAPKKTKAATKKKRRAKAVLASNPLSQSVRPSMTRADRGRTSGQSRSRSSRSRSRSMVSDVEGKEDVEDGVVEAEEVEGEKGTEKVEGDAGGDVLGSFSDEDDEDWDIEFSEWRNDGRGRKKSKGRRGQTADEDGSAGVLEALAAADAAEERGMGVGEEDEIQDGRIADPVDVSDLRTAAQKGDSGTWRAALDAAERSVLSDQGGMDAVSMLLRQEHEEDYDHEHRSSNARAAATMSTTTSMASKRTTGFGVAERSSRRRGGREDGADDAVKRTVTAIADLEEWLEAVENDEPIPTRDISKPHWRKQAELLTPAEKETRSKEEHYFARQPSVDSVRQRLEQYRMRLSTARSDPQSSTFPQKRRTTPERPSPDRSPPQRSRQHVQEEQQHEEEEELMHTLGEFADLAADRARRPSDRQWSPPRQSAASTGQLDSMRLRLERLQAESRRMDDDVRKAVIASKVDHTSGYEDAEQEDDGSENDNDNLDGDEEDVDWDEVYKTTHFDRQRPTIEDQQQNDYQTSVPPGIPPSPRLREDAEREREARLRAHESALYSGTGDLEPIDDHHPVPSSPPRPPVLPPTSPRRPESDFAATTADRTTPARPPAIDREPSSPPPSLPDQYSSPTRSKTSPRSVVGSPSSPANAPREEVIFFSPESSPSRTPARQPQSTSPHRSDAKSPKRSPSPLRYTVSPSRSNSAKVQPRTSVEASLDSESHEEVSDRTETQPERLDRYRKAFGQEPSESSMESNTAVQKQSELARTLAIARGPPPEQNLSSSYSEDAPNKRPEDDLQEVDYDYDEEDEEEDDNMYVQPREEAAVREKPLWRQHQKDDNDYEEEKELMRRHTSRENLRTQEPENWTREAEEMLRTAESEEFYSRARRYEHASGIGGGTDPLPASVASTLRQRWGDADPAPVSMDDGYSVAALAARRMAEDSQKKEEERLGAQEAEEEEEVAERSPEKSKSSALRRTVDPGTTMGLERDGRIVGTGAVDAPEALLSSSAQETLVDSRARAAAALRLYEEAKRQKESQSKKADASAKSEDSSSEQRPRDEVEEKKEVEKEIEDVEGGDGSEEEKEDKGTMMDEPPRKTASELHSDLLSALRAMEEADAGLEEAERVREAAVLHAAEVERARVEATWAAQHEAAERAAEAAEAAEEAQRREETAAAEAAAAVAKGYEEALAAAAAERAQLEQLGGGGVSDGGNVLRELVEAVGSVGAAIREHRAVRAVGVQAQGPTNVASGGFAGGVGGGARPGIHRMVSESSAYSDSFEELSSSQPRSVRKQASYGSMRSASRYTMDFEEDEDLEDDAGDDSVHRNVDDDLAAEVVEEDERIATMGGRDRGRYGGPQSVGTAESIEEDSEVLAAEQYSRGAPQVSDDLVGSADNLRRHSSLDDVPEDVDETSPSEAEAPEADLASSYTYDQSSFPATTPKANLGASAVSTTSGYTTDFDGSRTSRRPSPQQRRATSPSYQDQQSYQPDTGGGGGASSLELSSLSDAAAAAANAVGGAASSEGRALLRSFRASLADRLRNELQLANTRATAARQRAKRVAAFAPRGPAGHDARAAAAAELRAALADADARRAKAKQTAWRELAAFRRSIRDDADGGYSPQDDEEVDELDQLLREDAQRLPSSSPPTDTAHVILNTLREIFSTMSTAASPSGPSSSSPPPQQQQPPTQPSQPQPERKPSPTSPSRSKPQQLQPLSPPRSPKRTQPAPLPPSTAEQEPAKPEEAIPEAKPSPKRVSAEEQDQSAATGADTQDTADSYEDTFDEDVEEDIPDEVGSVPEIDVGEHEEEEEKYHVVEVERPQSTSSPSPKSPSPKSPSPKSPSPKSPKSPSFSEQKQVPSPRTLDRVADSLVRDILGSALEDAANARDGRSGVDEAVEDEERQFASPSHTIERDSREASLESRDMVVEEEEAAGPPEIRPLESPERFSPDRRSSPEEKPRPFESPEQEQDQEQRPKDEHTSPESPSPRELRPLESPPDETGDRPLVSPEKGVLDTEDALSPELEGGDQAVDALVSSLVEEALQVRKQRQDSSEEVFESADPGKLDLSRLRRGIASRRRLRRRETQSPPSPRRDFPPELGRLLDGESFPKGTMSTTPPETPPGPPEVLGLEDFDLYDFDDGPSSGPGAVVGSLDDMETDTDNPIPLPPLPGAGMVGGGVPSLQPTAPAEIDPAEAIADAREQLEHAWRIDVREFLNEVIFEASAGFRRGMAVAEPRPVQIRGFEDMEDLMYDMNRALTSNAMRVSSSLADEFTTICGQISGTTDQQPIPSDEENDDIEDQTPGVPKPDAENDRTALESFRREPPIILSADDPLPTDAFIFVERRREERAGLSGDEDIARREARQIIHKAMFDAAANWLARRRSDPVRAQRLMAPVEVIDAAERHRTATIQSVLEAYLPEMDPESIHAVAAESGSLADLAGHAFRPLWLRNEDRLELQHHLERYAAQCAASGQPLDGAGAAARINARARRDVAKDGTWRAGHQELAQVAADVAELLFQDACLDTARELNRLMQSS